MKIAKRFLVLIACFLLISLATLEAKQAWPEWSFHVQATNYAVLAYLHWQAFWKIFLPLHQLMDAKNGFRNPKNIWAKSEDR